MGQLHYFLGLEVLRNQHGIYLSQKKYVIEMLKYTGLLYVKDIETPLEFGVKLQQEEGELLEDVGKYIED